MNLTLRALRVASLLRQEEWDPESKITLSYRGNELAGEVGEACNIIKKVERENLGLKGSRATMEELSDELADVIICCDLVSLHLNIDLDEAVVRKFNATSAKYGLTTMLPVTKKKEK